MAPKRNADGSIPPTNATKTARYCGFFVFTITICRFALYAYCILVLKMVLFFITEHYWGTVLDMKLILIQHFLLAMYIKIRKKLLCVLSTT